jgi:hypothetical protein
LESDWVVVQYNFDYSPSLVPDASAARVDHRGQFQVFPNPVAGRMIARFALPEEAPVDLALYDVMGRVVRRLARGSWPAGSYAVEWDGFDADGRRVPSGVYFCELRQPGARVVRRLVVVE